MKLVESSKTIIVREITKAKHVEDARVIIDELYKNTKDKRLIVMDAEYPWLETLSGFKEPIYVIYPEPKNSTWIVDAIRDNPQSFVNRKDLPLSWAGKRDEELQKITGVSDAIFCHNKRFIAVAGSKEGAIALAHLAINAKP